MKTTFSTFHFSLREKLTIYTFTFSSYKTHKPAKEDSFPLSLTLFMAEIKYEDVCDGVIRPNKKICVFRVTRPTQTFLLNITRL